VPTDAGQAHIVFNVLVSNVDDHLRNHGFLYAGSTGWRLAPAYDLNPVPVDVKPRALSTAVDEDDASASLELSLSVAEYFDLTQKEAKAIAVKVRQAVSQWRTVAAEFGIGRAELERMHSAFEHRDLEHALSMA
jgi:serine/threonine-protein kinase HipA